MKIVSHLKKNIVLLWHELVSTEVLKYLVVFGGATKVKKKKKRKKWRGKFNSQLMEVWSRDSFPNGFHIICPDRFFFKHKTNSVWRRFYFFCSYCGEDTYTCSTQLAEAGCRSLMGLQAYEGSHNNKEPVDGPWRGVVEEMEQGLATGMFSTTQPLQTRQSVGVNHANDYVS